MEQMILYKAPYEMTYIRFSVWSASVTKICQRCGEYNPTVCISHRNTAYADNHNNYASFCDDCRRDDDEYYDELWDDYNDNIRQGLYL